MRSHALILLLACVTAISGCSESNPHGNEVNPSTKSIASPLVSDIPLKQNPEPQQTPAKIELLARKVRRVRSTTSDWDAIMAMHELQKIWSPVGKKTGDVVQILGKPSVEDSVMLIYLFANGDLTYKWTLQKDGDAISSISMLIDE